MTEYTSPKLNTLIYDLPEEIVIKTDYAVATGDVDLGELFKAKKRDDSYIFEHEDSVRKWLSFICGDYASAPTGIKLPFADKVISKKLNHILWVLPSMAACNALASLIKTVDEAKAINDNYEIVNCNDPACTTPEMVATAITDVISGNPTEYKTLTLMSRLLLKDIQFPYWTGVFILRNFGSNGYGDYVQIADSAKIPWKEGEEVLKKECYLFSFSSKKTLVFTNNILRKEYRNRYFSDDVDSFKKFIRQGLKDSPVEYWSLSGKESIDEDVIYEADPNESRSLWTSRRLIDDAALAEFIKDKAHKKALNVTGKREIDRLASAIDTIQNINSRIPAYLYLMEGKDKSLVDHLRLAIESGKDSKVKKGSARKKLTSSDISKFELLDFEAIFGITPELFLELTENKVLRTESIDRLACDFRASEIVPFLSSQHDKARNICPSTSVGMVFTSMSWPDFKYQYREVDAWDQLLDNICSPEKENENSIRAITMLLCYLQLLKPALESSLDGACSYEIDAESLTEQFLRVVSVKEESADIMNDFQQSDPYDLWVFPDPSVVSINDLYKDKISDVEYLTRLIADVRRRSEKMIEHYNASHSFNRYQRANEPYYSDDKTILLNVPQGEDEVIVEDGTVVIGRNAFLNCSKLKRVVLPKTVQIIEEGAFHGCSKLDSIECDGSSDADWHISFNKQIKKVAKGSFSDSGIDISDKEFCENQYKTKSFFYQEAEMPHSVKVWCVDESGFYSDAAGNKHFVSQDEGVILPCIDSNFKDHEDELKNIVRSFLQNAQTNSETFYDIAPIYLSGTEKEVDERMRQIAFLFCAKKNLNPIQVGNIRFDENLYDLIHRVMDERVSKSSVGGTIYLSFDINSAELNSQEFADFLKEYYSDKENVKADLVNFCRKENIGMTFYPNTGVFIDEEETDPESQMKVEENSYTIKIIYVSSSKLDSIAEKLCKTYYQQSVLVEDEINNRAYFKKHPLVQPNMDTLERDNVVLFKAFEEFKLRKKDSPGLE